MSQNITLIRIFVSCPGDVENEKKIVEDICKQKNDQLKQHNCTLVFTVSEWKQIIGEHGPRPQGIINDRMNYDIYLGIFWNRFGTPTGELNIETGEVFGSGTEEEYYEALRKWKRNKEAMLMYLFFKAPDRSKNAEEAAQILKVQQFREKTFPTGWVNDFSRTEEFNIKINAVFDGIIIKYLQTTNRKNFQLNGKTSLESIGILKNNFEKIVSPIQYYIPRTIRKVIGVDEIENTLLMDGIQRSRRVVLLANAGAGKSIALQQMGREVLNSLNPMIPIYQRFNTYVDKDLEDFLPQEWKDVDPDNLLLLLDGLDEVPPDHFVTVIRKIQDFSDRHANVKIVVSCRTNFYNLPNDMERGNLKGFDCYFLSEPTENHVIDYVSAVLQTDGLHFIEEAYGHGFYDVIFNPFFLNLLMTYYKEQHHLASNRTDIIRHFVESRIKFDQQHFETTVELELSKKEILKISGKVALAMELMGKNHITKDELYEIVKLPDERRALRYFSAFNKSVQQEGAFQFEHNNIREYLAAYLLADQPLETLESLVCFAPDFHRIKPNWANTLSFLLNIGDKGETEQLVNWLIEKDPEMVVKAERERVEPAVRLLAFKRIFEFYKEKQIWLQSNKFKISELATFSESEEAVEYLIQIFKDKSLSKVVRLNAIDILEEMDMGKYAIYLPSIKQMMIDSLQVEQLDGVFVHSVLSAMGKLAMNDKETLAIVLELFSKRSNQYIRAGLYKIIVGSDYLNDYVDLFLEGIFMTDEEEWKNDRGNVNLAEENIYLNRGLKKFNSAEAIKKILAYFTDPLDRRHMRYYDKYEVIAAVVSNACEVYQKDKSVYEAVYAFFITTGRTFDYDYSKSLCTFFRLTKTNVRAFMEVWNNTVLKHFEKDSLLAGLTDLDVLECFIKGVEDGIYSNEDVKWFHEALIHNKSMNSVGDFVTELEKLVEERCHFHLERLLLPDYKAQQLARKQSDFDLLFDKEKFLTEVSAFFDRFGLKEVSAEEVTELGVENLYAASDDDRISSVVYDFLKDLTSDKAWSLAEVRAWIKDAKLFDNYRVFEVYEFLRHDPNLSLSNGQKTFIINQCIVISEKMDWENVAWIKGNAENNSFSVDPYAPIVWYFVKRIGVPLPEEMLLSFTMFDDFDTDGSQSSVSHIAFLEGIVNKKALKAQVVKNIKKGIGLSFIWRSNARYAIANDLMETFPHILEYIKNRDEFPEYIRAEILDLLFEKTIDANTTLDVLTRTNSTVIQWRCVDRLLSNGEHVGFLINFLKSILAAEVIPNERGLKAAGYLTELNCLEGLKYYLGYLSSDKKAALDLDHARRCFTKITNVEAVPLLMELLQIALKPEYRTADYFHRVDPVFMDALQQIAVSSEEGLKEVRIRLTAFIRESSLPNLNFLYTSIAKMEEAYYLSQSKSLPLKAVVRILSALE